MSTSRQEEIISALWMICALLAFGFGFKVAGWLFGIKAGLDTVCSLYFAIVEFKKRNGGAK